MKRIIFFLILPIFLNAKVILNAPKTFLSGEPVIFSISASGNDVDFPEIKNINGYVVQQAGTSSQTSIINGVRSQKLTRQYKFYPTSNTTIPSFEININGKTEKTKEHKITLQKVKKTKSDIFDLTIKVDKKDVYVGEELLLTMTFKYKKNTQIYDLQFVQPQFENFWSKQVKSDKKPYDSLYVVQELNFLLFPQKHGTLDIKPFKIDAILPDFKSNNTFFGTPTKTYKIYSNSLKINAKPLPDDIYLVGDFKIKTKINKNSIKSGEAVSLQLKISGRGNIDDLEEYNINIPNATIYDNPSKKDFNIKNGKYGGIYKKSYSITANNDFTIPAITLKYFDKNTKQVKTVKSQEHKIKVEGTKKVKQQLEVKKEKPKTKQVIQTKTVTKVVETSNGDKILFFSLGMISAIILFAIYFILKNKQTIKDDLPLEKSIKNCKTQSELLKIVIPYINIDKNLDKIIYEIESDKNIDFKLTKKRLLNIVKELKL